MTSSSHSTPEGREARFRALHEATYADLLRFAGRRVHPSHAEDVAAEALTVAWRRLEDLPAEPDAARAWVFGVARGVMLNQRRGERRRQALAVRLADGEGRPADPPGVPEEDLVVGRVDLARAWRRLTPSEQEVLGLAVLDDLDSAGAGRVLGCSAVAFRLRLSRARKALRGHLDAAPPSVSPIARGLSR